MGARPEETKLTPACFSLRSLSCGNRSFAKTGSVQASGKTERENGCFCVQERSLRCAVEWLRLVGLWGNQQTRQRPQGRAQHFHGNFTVSDEMNAMHSQQTQRDATNTSNLTMMLFTKVSRTIC